MGDEQDDCDREDDDAGEEVALALDDFIRFRILEQGRVFDFAADLLVHDDVEVDQREDKTDACDRTGVGDEVAERVVQRGTDDDVRRVTAHGGRATEVGAEDFCNDHRARIEPQESGQLDGGAGQEQDDRDAVDEHRQRRGQCHECDEDLDRVVFDGLGEGQAEPFEEACMSHAFDHDHHTADEQDRSPVDTARFFGGFVCRIPERRMENVLECQCVNDRLRAAHADAEDENDHQKTGAEGDQVPRDLLHDDHHEHDDEDTDCEDLRNQSVLLRMISNGCLSLMCESESHSNLPGCLCGHRCFAKKHKDAHKL